MARLSDATSKTKAQTGAGTLAVRFNIKKGEAEAKLEAFYNAYRDARIAAANSIRIGKMYGFVEDIKGRRRRLKELQLPIFSAYYMSDKTINEENPDGRITRYLKELEHNIGNKAAVKKLIEVWKTFLATTKDLTHLSAGLFESSR